MKNNQIITLGCRINSYESEIIRQIIKDCPDYIIFNTCTVTAEAHRQSLQAIRKARRENPNSKIVVTGCAATISPEDFIDIADIVIANKNKLEPKAYLNGSNIIAPVISGFEGRNRAFIQVQQGCDYSCTYCIVPKARGASYSISYEKLYPQIEAFLQNGVKEITLTGINLSDYSGGVPHLTKQILKDFTDIRLRFGSLDPAMVDDEMIELFSDKRLLPHLHLSVQSGDNLILKRMKRRHNREQIISISQKLHKLRPEIMLGADFITGFPTETEENFKNTYNLVKEAQLSMLHVFPYSERAGTPAVLMPQVEKSIRKSRAALLRKAGEELLIQKLQEKVGKTLLVLFEKDEKGHSDEYISVNANGKQGKISKVLITEARNNELYGEVV